MIGSVLANDLGQMRVRFEGSRFQVPAPYRDDHSHLWEQAQDAAEPLPVGEVEPLPSTGSALSDPSGPASSRATDEAAQTAVRTYSYPEWHARTQVLREHWCTVIESVAVPAGNTPNPAGPPPLWLPALRTPPQGRVRRRLHEGEQLDLDAVIDHAVQRRQGRVPDGRVFRRPAPLVGAIQLLILLDRSESTGRSLAGGPTLLDVERRAALLLARHLGAQGHRVAVHAFNSDTRERVHYLRLLEFGASPGDVERALNLPLSGQYSTRLGAAIRHAAQCLHGRSGLVPMLLVLTDGMPSDIDVFDPGHLVEDARHAVRQARRTGLRVSAVVIDDDEQNTVSTRIFGAGHASVVKRPQQLAGALKRLFQQGLAP